MANARFSVGWALAQLDHPTEGISLMRQGLTSLLESGQEGEQNELRMSALAQAQHRAGSLNEALETIEQALQMLTEIYHWFTFSPDTPDLKDARALLDELAT